MVVVVMVYCSISRGQATTTEPGVDTQVVRAVGEGDMAMSHLRHTTRQEPRVKNRCSVSCKGQATSMSTIPGSAIRQ